MSGPGSQTIIERACCPRGLRTSWAPKVVRAGARALAVVGVVCATAGVSLGSATAAGAANGGTQVFTYTGTTQTFTVPAGVTAIVVNAIGASGGAGSQVAGGSGGASGVAGRVTAEVSVTPGEV
jgi:hypothetical protein